ncbi:MAG TPA: hypothetical protein VEG30_06000 [Terriglobales bacterium]|nr:hypothetical protein [Terriglobales bacterium]
MLCVEFREHLLDLAVGEAGVTGTAAEEHVRSCPDCAGELQSLRQTMNLLDEWKAPEDTSPYFMTRLRARVREEAGRETRAGWLSWFRKPALALTSAALLLLGISLFTGGGKNRPVASVPNGLTSSAVSDLKVLDDNHDLLANFELLDDDDAQQVAQ